MLWPQAVPAQPVQWPHGSSDGGHPGPAGQSGLRSWTALLRCHPPLGPRIPSRQPHSQTGANRAQGRDARGEGQVMNLIDLLGSSVCHPADVKMGSGRTGRTPMRLLVPHSSQGWGPWQSGARPNGRGSVTNPSGSAGPQWASARPAWSPRRARVGAGGSGSPFRLLPFKPEWAGVSLIL